MALHHAAPRADTALCTALLHVLSPHSGKLWYTVRNSFQLSVLLGEEVITIPPASQGDLRVKSDPPRAVLSRVGESRGLENTPASAVSLSVTPTQRLRTEHWCWFSSSASRW